MLSYNTQVCTLQPVRVPPTRSVHNIIFVSYNIIIMVLGRKLRHTRFFFVTWVTFLKTDEPNAQDFLSIRITIQLSRLWHRLPFDRDTGLTHYYNMCSCERDDRITRKSVTYFHYDAIIKTILWSSPRYLQL